MQVPEVTEQFVDAAIQFNVALKTARIYPSNHDQVRLSTEKAFVSLKKALSVNRKITFSVAANRFFVQEMDLRHVRTGLNTLISSLSSHDFSGLTFRQGIDGRQFRSLLELLATSPDANRENESLHLHPKLSQINNVDILPVDYSLFHVDDKRELADNRSADGHGDEKDIWMAYSKKLVSSTHCAHMEGEADKKPTDDQGPDVVADFLNTYDLKENETLQFYEEMLDCLIEHSDPENKEIDEKFADNIKMINTLLDRLNPDIRRQFLSTTFQKCEQMIENRETRSFLANLSETMVIEMLALANEQGRTISPALLTIVQKLVNAQQLPDKAIPEGISRSDVQNLLDPENYDKYVSTSYSRILKELAENKGIKKGSLKPVLPVEEYLKTFDEDYLDSQIGSALLILMESELSGDAYRDYGKELVKIAIHIPENVNVSLLVDMINVIKRHRAEKKDALIRRHADHCYEQITRSEFLEDIIRSLLQLSGLLKDEALRLLSETGNRYIRAALRVYGSSESQWEKQLLLDLFMKFKVSVVAEIVRLLKTAPDDGWHYLFDLLQLLRVAKAHKDIKAFLEHPEKQIRLKAIETLIVYNDDRAMDLLKKLLKSNDIILFAGAAAIAAKLRLHQVTGDLSARLSRYFLTKNAIRRNRHIISALGRIGSPDVIKRLEKIAKASGFFYPKETLRMKRVLFESLEGYPYEKIARLQGLGLQSGDEIIENICKNLLIRSKGPEFS